MIDQSDYEREVKNAAVNLDDAVEETDDDALNTIVDVINDHPWFARDNPELSGADFGAIVSDFDLAWTTDPANIRDPESAIDAYDFEDTLRSLAFMQFESDVLGYYEEKYE